MKPIAFPVVTLFFASLLQAVSSFGQSVSPTGQEPLKIDVVTGVSHMLNKPELACPKDALQQHIEGRVELELTVSPQGDVIAERVISGPSALQEAAKDALKKAKYIPFLRNLEPCAAAVRVVVDYEKDQATISTESEQAAIGTDFRGRAIQEAVARAAAIGTGSGVQTGNVEILSDTQGVNFGPYLQGVLHAVRQNWYALISESAQMKHGNLIIEFAIMKDGSVQGLRLANSSSDVALDRPAYGSIAASSPFPPLPREFNGQYLALRFRFFYNPSKEELAPAKPTTSPPVVK